MYFLCVCSVLSCVSCLLFSMSMGASSFLPAPERNFGQSLELFKVFGFAPKSGFRFRVFFDTSRRGSCLCPAQLPHFSSWASTGGRAGRSPYVEGSLSGKRTCSRGNCPVRNISCARNCTTLQEPTFGRQTHRDKKGRMKKRRNQKVDSEKPKKRKSGKSEKCPTLF